MMFNLNMVYKLLKYNISEKQFIEILEKQNFICAICKTHIKNITTKGKFKFPLHIDHDHKTGIVRGLLCSQCNTGLGMFKDNVAHLQSAIEYLNNNKE